MKGAPGAYVSKRDGVFKGEASGQNGLKKKRQEKQLRAVREDSPEIGVDAAAVQQLLRHQNPLKLEFQLRNLEFAIQYGRPLPLSATGSEFSVIKKLY